MSEIKVNKLSPRSGTAVTLGDSGDTFTIPSGATLAIAGSVTGFTSAGIDDNATSVAITIDSSERVGIGTTSPSSLLHLSSSAPKLIIQDTGTHGTNSAPRLEFKDSSSIQGFVEFADDGTMRIDQLKANPLTFLTNNVERARFDASGNLLVGTTVNNPYTSNVNGVSIRGSNTSMQISKDGNASLLLNRKSSDGQIIQLGKDGSAIGSIGVAGSNPFLTNQNSRGISLGSNVVPCDNAGSAVNNLSDLGTSSARFKDLHLGGSIIVGDSHTIGDDPSDNLEIKSSSNEGIIYNSANGLHLFEKNSTEVMRIDTNGNVGIGNSGPGRNLSINGSTQTSFVHFTNTGTGTTDTDGLLIGNDNQGSYFINRENSFTIFMNNNTESMRIDASGNVGIGLTNPGSFHVSGNDLVVGNTTGGHGLTIVSSTNDAGSINFGDATNASTRGKITYEHSNDSLAFHTGASQKLLIGNNGNISIGTSADARTVNVFDSVPIVALYNSTTGTGNSDGFQLQLSSDDGYLWNYESGGHTIFGTAGTERMRITSAGKVLVNTTGEYAGTGAEMTVNDGIDVGTTSTANGGFVSFIGDGVGKIGEVGSKVSGYSTMPNIEFHADNVSGGSQAGHIEFNTKFSSGSRSEAFRISSNGDLMQGGTSRVSSEGVGLYIENAGGNDGAIIELKHTRNAGGSRDFLRFFNNADGEAGAIVHSGATSVTYATSSDYRLKENVDYNFDATTRLKQLKPARFNFISEPEKTVDGFIAHEVSSIVPEAITGEKDAINAKGKPSYQGIDQAKLVPLLVKTIQELEARITTLENA